VTDPDPLLAAIRRTPTDRTLRLAYADWLEEQADPRHELIRVCEAMRDVPVYSDEYWRLKARRNELRKQCPAGWLATTGYDGSYYDPIFRDGVPDDSKGRWRLIREFTERWHDIPTADVGGRQAEIRETEQRLGRQLPPSLREYVAFAHDTTRPNRPPDEPLTVIRDWLSLEPVPGHRATSIMVHCEGDLHYAIQPEDWLDPDPAIWTYGLTVEGDWVTESPYEPTYPSLSDLMLDYVLLFMHSMDGFGGRIVDLDRLRSDLVREFPIHVRVGENEYFEGTAMLVRLYPYSGGHIISGVLLPARSRESTPQFLWPYTPEWWGYREPSR
jgi:uncharacterized protein (TIGR02996 family)